MDKIKKYERTNNDLQNIHIKLKIKYHEPHQRPGVLRRGRQFLLH
jgi:hypothetical protein